MKMVRFFHRKCAPKLPRVSEALQTKVNYRSLLSGRKPPHGGRAAKTQTSEDGDEEEEEAAVGVKRASAKSGAASRLPTEIPSDYDSPVEEWVCRECRTGFHSCFICKQVCIPVCRYVNVCRYV